ncbi:putative aldo/keto reductase [Colletotrichum sublineola]|uniref:Putative aldo/keto reductase n=1 Tax=Colletotrichum sublineola TaxID=1173701 RepID=A0A066WZL2_COLSU|nr:putative aldo/keto reductase [Colletotrichum sublineola]
MSAPPVPASLQKSLDATKVEYVNLGTSGLKVSVPILGGMSLGSSMLSRKTILKAVNNALKRLGTTYINLFQIHHFNPTTPINKTIKALHNLIQAGKILYISASSI